MNIILLDNIEKVGAKHDVVKVKDGYGRNYLLPRGLAIVANKVNLAKLEGMKKQAAKKEAVIITSFKEIAAKLADTTLKITAKAGETGRLFGSVTAADVVTAVAEQAGVTLDRKHLDIDPIKSVGQHTVTAHLHTDVSFPITVEVVPA